MNLCECGCGEVAKPGRRFCYGHNRKGKKFSAAHAEKHKKACAEANRRPERRAQSRELMKLNCKSRKPGEFHHSEETKKLIGEKGKGRPSWNKGLIGAQEAWNKGKKAPQISKGKMGHIVTLEQREKNRNGTLKFMQENPEEFLKNTRSGAIAMREKYPNKGDGHFFNTRPEKEMKRCFEELGIKYMFQFPVKNIEHSYVADFYLPLYNLIIEVDGKNVHSKPSVIEKDSLRMNELESIGYRILRFEEGEFDAQRVWAEI